VISCMLVYHIHYTALFLCLFLLLKNMDLSTLLLILLFSHYLPLPPQKNLLGKNSLLVILFFFSSRRRHTRSKRDWSSDVCSSDLRDIHDYFNMELDVGAA